jgi:murein hydrolase activator
MLDSRADRGLRLTAAVIALPLLAQAPAPFETLKQREQELEMIRSEQSRAVENEIRLRAEIAAIAEDRRKLNGELIETAARVREIEGRIAATEARLQPLDADERAIRQSLDGRRAVIAEVLAILQRVGRSPPPALIVRPEDALNAVRSAILLGAVLPEMRHEAEALVGQLTELVAIRKEIAAERARLAREWSTLSEANQRMNLLVQERQRQQADTEKTLEAERQRAVALARQVDNLKDLIGKLEQGLDSATRASRRAGESENRSNLAALRDPGRLAPAIAFASAKGSLPLPVNGVKIRDFGSPDGTGGSERGLAIATRATAQVTAPCDGWVVYAGPFRSYGQLLILNAGGGYHVLLAGMERISVNPGQFVLTGEPVALMGDNSHIAAVLATGSSQPVLYVEFRKDGTPIDPSPWWAASEGEKARG